MCGVWKNLLRSFRFLRFAADGTAARSEPSLPAEKLAEVSIPSGVVHDQITARVEPRKLRLGDQVAILFETSVRFGELRMGKVTFVPFHVVNKCDDRETRVKRTDRGTQPFRKTVGTDSIVNGGQFCQFVLPENFPVLQFQFLCEFLQVFDFSEGCHFSPFTV